jgi:hypothetical protein
VPPLSEAYGVEIYSYTEAYETSKILGDMSKISCDKTCYRGGYGTYNLKHVYFIC